MEADGAAALTKALAGAAPEFAVKIRLNGKEAVALGGE
jgi:hypothetical protein